MTLKEGIKNLGSPFTIPMCSRDELPAFLKERGCKVGAEVGVYKGHFTEKFCKAGLTMYAIDPWKAFTGQGRTQNLQDRQDFLYAHTHRVLSPYSNCTIIRKTSLDAGRTFSNECLDFVYIDGDHSLRAVIDDILTWHSKVRVGGIVAGHDYFCTDPNARNIVCQVKPAVHACVEVLGIKNWYIFGRSKPLEQEAKDDRYMSWLWIKE